MLGMSGNLRYGQRMMKFAITAIGVLVATGAMADVAPPIEPGKVFVENRVHVDNMAEHPDWVLLVYDAPRKGEIKASLAFHAGAEKEQSLVHGGSWRSAGRFSKPKLWLVAKAAWETWKKETGLLVAKQREACAQRGEGCAHISRFQPHFPPPKGAVDCNASIDVVLKQKSSLGKTVVSKFSLKEAKAGSCKVTRLDKKGGLAAPPSPGGPSPWLIGGFLAVLLGLVAVFLLASRRTKHTTAPLS